MPCPIAGLRSPRAAVRGLVHFPRLVDKARLMAAGRLPADYQAALGRGFDRRVCEALRVSYAELAAEAVSHPEASDEALLAWAESRGRALTEGDIEVLSAFLSKRGWRDDATPTFERRREEAGAPAMLLTYFELIDWDEGR